MPLARRNCPCGGEGSTTFAAPRVDGAAVKKSTILWGKEEKKILIPSKINNIKIIY